MGRPSLVLIEYTNAVYVMDDEAPINAFAGQRVFYLTAVATVEDMQRRAKTKLETNRTLNTERQTQPSQ